MADTLAAHPGWRLAAAAPATWRGRGRTTLAGGERCIRADPAEDLCHGFFVAAFEKVEDGGGHTERDGKKGNRSGGRQSANDALVMAPNGGEEGIANGGKTGDGQSKTPRQKKKKRKQSETKRSEPRVEAPKADYGGKILDKMQPSCAKGDDKSDEVLDEKPDEARKRKRKHRKKAKICQDITAPKDNHDKGKSPVLDTLDVKRLEASGKKKNKHQIGKPVANGDHHGIPKEVSGDVKQSDASAQGGQTKKKKRGRSEARDEDSSTIPLKRSKNEATEAPQDDKTGKYLNKKSGRLSKRRRNRLKHTAVLTK